MMTVILLTVPMCAVFWKASSFLIKLTASGKEFRFCGKGLSQKEDRHDPSFHRFRSRTAAFGRYHSKPASLAVSSAGNHSACGQTRQKRRISPAFDGDSRRRGTGR